MEVNPYTAPETARPILHPEETPALFRRKGISFLQVREGAVLPARCIRTNVGVDPDDCLPSRKLQCLPYRKGMVVLISAVPFIGPLWLSMRRITFNLTFQLSPEERRRIRLQRILGTALLLGGILCFITMGVWLDSNIASIKSGTEPSHGTHAIYGGLALTGILILAGIIALARTTVLRAIRHEDGWFTLKGCGSQFLDSLGPP
ncbi:MAG: hypothetical protein QM755_00355 [Luteolibacter sp.]